MELIYFLAGVGVIGLIGLAWTLIDMSHESADVESQGQVFDSFREQRERYCLTPSLPPQPKRQRRELFSRQNLEVSTFCLIFAGEMKK